MNYFTVLLLLVHCALLVNGVSRALDVETEENETEDMMEENSEGDGEEKSAMDLIFAGNLKKITLVQELEKAKEKSGKPKFTSKTLGDAGLIYDGDILGDEAGNVDPLKFNGQISHAPSSNLRANFNWHKKLWMTRTIPWVITSSINSKTKKLIHNSIAHIQSQTCLKFRPKQRNDKNWIEFYYGSGCYSGIGKKYWGTYATRISLGSGCSAVSVIVHEMLHAIGFPHEQSRRDRESYVKYYPNKVMSGMESNFRVNEVEDINTMGTPYDYKSIMHYTATSFSVSPPDHTLENKFDPQMPLGNKVMSPTDVLELNLLYQCSIQGPWSYWSEMSACVCDWRKECTKAKVRFCISEDKSRCPGADQDGVQEYVEQCSKSDGDKAKKKKDGHFGNWGAFTPCSGDCGWGTQIRTRSCNNPPPTSGGKGCVGFKVEHLICRRARCSGAGPLDTDFTNNNRRGWAFNGFSVVNGKIPWTNPNVNNLRTAGPIADHTRDVTNAVSVGYYAAAWGKNKQATMKHTVTNPKSKKCIMFHYMLNGEYIRTGDPLTVYTREISTNIYRKLNINVHGHTGNYWRRAAMDIEYRNKPYEIIITAKFQAWRESAVAIDDIFFDNNPCPHGLNGCSNIKSAADCKKMALEGRCNSPNIGVKRIMLGECCVTCQDPKYYTTASCADKHDKCVYWKEHNQCAVNPWMMENCCKSCVTNCKKGSNANCAGWANAGECKKNPWMWNNCCQECMAAEKKG